MRIQQWTLRSKVVLHIVVLGMLSAAILTVVYLTTQRSVIISLSREKAELVGNLMLNTVFLVQKCANAADAEAKIHEMVEATNDVTNLRIVTTGGRIFASLKPGEQDKPLAAEDLARIKDMLTRRAPTHIEFLGGGATLRSLILVENSPACYACHAPEQKVNGFLEVTFDSRDTAAILRRSQWRGILLALVALAALTIIVLRLFDRLINRPISRLKDRMKEVQGGNLDVHLESRTDDEIGSLTKSFNAMVANLREANRKIEELYNQRLEKAEHLAAFGELAAGLAHEVRNPLSGMKGALEIIGQSAPPGDPNKEIYEEILIQIDKMIAVIQDFLSYARPKPSRFGPVPPSRFVENAIRLALTQLGGKDIQIHFQPLPAEPAVGLDEDRMQEVVLNLLVNSIAAIEAAGNILIVEKVEPGVALVLVIADNGAGIKESQVGQIFNPFFSTKKGGTGLGLSISRKTIDDHGGTILVESREGKGTTFTIRLPLDATGA
jgi:signal transduction histidine kinase